MNLKFTRLIRVVFLAVTTILVVLSCSKFEDVTIDSPELSAVAAIKRQFDEQEESYSKSGQSTQKTFRQSLERELDWDFAEFVKDTLYVPIDLSLPENHYSKGGHAFLQNRVWLQAVKISGTDDYYFKMLTAFPDSSRNTDKFNGLIVYEDYFVGSKKTLAFENSVRSNKRIVSATKKHSSESLSKASALDCYDVQVGTVCVGDPRQTPKLRTSVIQFWKHYAISRTGEVVLLILEASLEAILEGCHQDWVVVAEV